MPETPLPLLRFGAVVSSGNLTSGGVKAVDCCMESDVTGGGPAPGTGDESMGAATTSGSLLPCGIGGGVSVIAGGSGI